MSEPTPKLLYFCDETSLHDPHMAVGGLAVRLESIPRIYQDLAEINAKYGVSSEVKWTNCKRYRGVAHKAYVDYLFKRIEERVIHLHVRFSPMRKYDHHSSGERKEIDTVSKSYFQLIVHRAARFYGNAHDIMVRLDNGDCTRLVPDFTDTINVHARSRYGYCTRDCVTHAQPLDSKGEPMLQLLDVTLGALASFRNARHSASDANTIKTDLARYAFERTGAKTIDGNTPLTRQNISIWNVTPSW